MHVFISYIHTHTHVLTHTRAGGMQYDADKQGSYVMLTHAHTHTHTYTHTNTHGVATVSRIDKIIGIF